MPGTFTGTVQRADMAAKPSGSQPAAGFRAELYAEELRTANPKILWNTRFYCPRENSAPRRLHRGTRAPSAPWRPAAAQVPMANATPAAADARMT